MASRTSRAERVRACSGVALGVLELDVRPLETEPEQNRNVVAVAVRNVEEGVPGPVRDDAEGPEVTADLDADERLAGTVGTGEPRGAGASVLRRGGASTTSYPSDAFAYSSGMTSGVLEVAVHHHGPGTALSARPAVIAAC